MNLPPSLFWLPTSVKCPQLWWFLLFSLGQSENFERKREDLVFDKFHEPLIVFSAEAS
jgi:hypothetical protein